LSEAHPHEIERLEASRARARQQLTDIARASRSAAARLASIFDAQLPCSTTDAGPRAAEIIRDQAVNAGWAIERVFEEFSALFDEIADSVSPGAEGDLADVVGRLEMNSGPACRRRLICCASWTKRQSSSRTS
jgi:phosphoenolpyruvate-protein kinase (PTS system EI component)